MPERRYHRGCGRGCLRCWRNRMKHANSLKKKKGAKAEEIAKKADYSPRIEPKYSVLPSGTLYISATNELTNKHETWKCQPRSEQEREKRYKREQCLHDYKVRQGILEHKTVQLPPRRTPNMKTELRDAKHPCHAYHD